MRGLRSGLASMSLVVGAFVAGCSGHPTEPTEALTFTYDFDLGPQGFTASFADYPPADAESYELTSDYRALPPPLEPRSALFISGVNRSDDLFMFFKRPVAGLSPGTSYGVSVSVEVATDTPAGCVGVGGAPGESVWIKAGATAVEPLPVRDGSYLRMNIDIGSQSAGGAQAVVLGDIANARGCEQPVDGHRDLRQSERESVQTPVPLPCSSRSWKKKMMAVVAVRNRVCAVLQTPVGAVVCVHRRVGVHSLRAGVSSGGSLG